MSVDRVSLSTADLNLPFVDLQPTRESEVSISPAKIAKLADPRDYLLPGASHTDLIETDQFGSSTV